MTMAAHEIHTGHCLLKLAPGSSPKVSLAASPRPFASLWPSRRPETAIGTLHISMERLSNTTSARSKVLSTVELLEQILLGIRWNELFVLQRVSSTWRDVIQESVLVREKMYILAIEAPLQPTTSLHYYADSMKRITYRSDKLDTNPATKFYGSSDAGLQNPLALWAVRDLSNFIQFSIGVEGTPEGLPNETASWRQMLLTKPPLPAISFDFLPDDEEHRNKLTIYNRRGITFGDVYDWTWKLSKAHEKKTGLKPDSRLAAIVFWLAHPDGSIELEEAW
ncbi:hypothetical protein AC579_8093 [Pseudocercospora musae]|uniref:F-box domain-containing protein n=1 Tax=Pseudocercospora musae TaxID=113226 RepID=A0A139IFV7_9PEZI|nr:hypothetical protein AC579_8093 [Pseudocercospora musae]